MLVRREASPVALGAVGLADGQDFCVGIAVDDEAGLSLEGNAAQQLQHHMVFPKHLRGGLFLHGCAADGDLDMVDGFDLQMLLTGHIEALGLPVLKYVGAVSHVLIALTVEGNVAVALQHDEGDFPVFGVERQLLPGVQLDDAELQLFQAALPDLADGRVALGGNVGFLVIHKFSSLRSLSTTASQSPTMP